MTDPALDPISPELVLVDPSLRARIAELPSGPTLPLRVHVVAPEPVPGPNRVFGRVAAGAATFLVFLALPLLCLASDLVRKPPRLAPARPVLSRLVNVGADQHVGPDLLRQKPVQPNGGR
jgi:hypothetical protein